MEYVSFHVGRQWKWDMPQMLKLYVWPWVSVSCQQEKGVESSGVKHKAQLQFGGVGEVHSLFFCCCMASITTSGGSPRHDDACHYTRVECEWVGDRGRGWRRERAHTGGGASA